MRTHNVVVVAASKKEWQCFPRRFLDSSQRTFNFVPDTNDVCMDASHNIVYRVIRQVRQVLVSSCPRTTSTQLCRVVV